MIPLVPVIQKEAWAQCENPNCGKWRKLPGGTPIDENEPWYCYMNPDATHNTCSASEVDYDEEKEIVIADVNDPEEAARNREIIERLEASIAAAAAAALASGRGRGRGRGRRGGRGRGRGGRAGYPGYYDPAAFPGGYGNEDMEGSDLEQQYKSQSRRQCAKSLSKLLENGGSWEAGSTRATTALPLVPPPAEGWEALAQYGGSDAVDLAVKSADLASAAQYFDDMEGGKAIAEESDTVARLAIALTAASGVAATEEVFAEAERAKLGLDGAEPVPDPSVPLDNHPLLQQAPMEGIEAAQ